MMKRKICGVLAVIAMMMLSACEGTEDVEKITTAEETDRLAETVIVTAEVSTVTAVTEEVPVNTASPEEVRRLIDEVRFPEITIAEDSTPAEIMLAGNKAGAYYGRAAAKYFGYGVDINWKYEDTDLLTVDGIAENPPYVYSTSYRKSAGLYTDRDNDIFAPMDHSEAKQFLMSSIGLTEQGFYELCLNSPSTYLGINGELYVHSGDGGQAGWSYSHIVGYELGENGQGEKTVTYNCERVGTAEDWGYEEDIIKPFTFRLAYADGLWKLDGVSYGEGFFELMRLDDTQDISE